MKPPSVQDKVLAKLKSQLWTSSSEIELLFPKGEPGHFSWPQRLRGLREPENGGYIITHRIKAGTKHLTEWHIEGQETTPPVTPVMAEAPVYFERNKQYAWIG